MSRFKKRLPEGSKFVLLVLITKLLAYSPSLWGKTVSEMSETPQSFFYWGGQ